MRRALVLVLLVACRSPPLESGVGGADLLARDQAAPDFSRDQSVPQDSSSPFDFTLPDLDVAGDLDGLHGCLGYSRCYDNCESEPTCILRCQRSATTRAVYLFNAAVACGHAYCQRADGMTAPRCIGQSDPPNAPSGTCVRCEQDAVGILLERNCVIQSPDCNAVACLPIVEDCIRDGD